MILYQASIRFLKKWNNAKMQVLPPAGGALDLLHRMHLSTGTGFYFRKRPNIANHSSKKN